MRTYGWLSTFLLAITIVAGAFHAESSRAQVPAPGSDPVPATLFGMHIHHLGSQTAWPAVPFGTWRLWDAGVAWINLEPTPGKWNFAVLDEDVRRAESHHVQLLLTLGMTPAWASASPDGRCPYGQTGCLGPPRTLDSWREYVRTVATRYKGRIRAYEVWNEPNGYFTGTVDQMVALTREARAVLKDIDPENIVVSPSATAGERGVQWLDTFLGAGGGPYVDVIAFHFYVTPQGPEAIQTLADKIRAVLRRHRQESKPVWNTEAGWLIQNRKGSVSPVPGYGNVVLDSQLAADYIARAYIVSWAAGIQRFYWYAWDNRLMGLVEEDGTTLKPAALAYQQTEQWLTGAHLLSCNSASAQTWTCSLTRNGVPQWIVWNAARSVRFQIPSTWHVSIATNLSGHSTPIASSAIEAGTAPQLLH